MTRHWDTMGKYERTWLLADCGFFRIDRPSGTKLLTHRAYIARGRDWETLSKGIKDKLQKQGVSK